MLLLDGLGTRLDSVRLAAPRLLQHACLSAIDERPDVLAIVGGPRAARRAGQLAHERDIPILFLPGFRSPEWARNLWGAMSLEEMIAALAQGAAIPARLDAAAASGRIFFDCASCGVLPHLAELRTALRETDSFSEDWQVRMRAAGLARSVLSPGIRFYTDDSKLCRSAALIVAAHRTPWREPREPAFDCMALHYGPAAYFGALLRSGFGGDWQKSAQARPFACETLTLAMTGPSWILLDGEAVHFDGPIAFRSVPGAIRTFVFSPAQGHANPDSRLPRSRFRSLSETGEPWNLSGPSHVRMPDTRESGDGRQRKQV